MDKAGHATTAYNIASIQSDIMHWGGVKPGISALVGTLTSLGFMTMVEVLDAHSEKWGFSKGDMLANIAGCVLFEGQHLLWHQQRISLKFSYHQTLFAQYYPQELGRNLPQRMLERLQWANILAVHQPGFVRACFQRFSKMAESVCRLWR